MTRAGASVRVRTGAAATLAAVVVVVSGCVEPDAPPPAEVRLTAAGFEPVLLETATGSEVRFVNRSERPQQLASAALERGAAAVPAGAEPIDSGRLVAGATYTAQLDVPGEYVVEAFLAGSGTPAVVTIQVEETP